LVADLVLLGPARASSADEGSLPASGATVRLAIEGQTVPIVGRLMSLDAEKIVVRPSGVRDERVIPRETLVAVDVGTHRPLRGLGAGVLAGAASSLLLSIGAHEGALGSAVAGAVLALPTAALGTALASQEHSTALAAVAGAAVDGVTFGLLLDGWCRGSPDSSGEGCFLGAALVGGAFGAVSAGIAAHVSHRHWTTVWTRRAQVSVAARAHGVEFRMRFAF